MKSWPILSFALAGSSLVLPFACSDTDELQGVSPPSGVGGRYDPGDGGLSSGATSTGSGYSSGSGNGAGGNGEPPLCDDSLKRCQHVFTYADKGETSVEIRGDFAPDGWTNGVPMTKSGGTWSATVEVPYNADVVYKFVLNGTTWIYDPSNPNQVSDGLGGINSKLVAERCDPFICVPVLMGKFDWRDAVLYFVFVDRFLNGDKANDGQPTPGVLTPVDYQGGDFQGVLSKIKDGYFTDLGVNALWLTVPLDNTEQSGKGGASDPSLYSAYHGYWPKNLDTTEEHFGTLPLLKAVVDAAHAANIKVILDYAMNHVHVSSPVYAAHNDWFWPLAYNGGQCVCGSGVCPWDSATEKRCWFTDYLPDFNFKNDAARAFSVDNAISWIKNTGADGFRLDAVKHIEDQWLIDLRSRVKTDLEPTSGEHFYMVGETFSGDRNLIRYYVNPLKMLDGQFDFPFRAELIKSVLTRTSTMQALDTFMSSNESFYGSGIMSTFIGNHDVPRSIHFAEDSPVWSDPWDMGKDRSWSNQPGLPAGTSAFERFAIAYTILLTTPGIPLIYYGDEIGMPGAGDPDNRQMMQWSGYSPGQSLLFEKVKKLNAIRAAHPALRRGKRTTSGVTADTLAYKMTSDTDVVYVVINRSDAPQQVNNLPGGALDDLLGGASVTGPVVAVPPRSSMVLLAP
jgi:glycosidase